VVDEFRVFHALRKGAPPQEAAALKADIRESLRRVVPTLNVIVTDAVEDFDANMARLGGWDGWESDVAMGVRYSDRAPRFHVIVLTDTEFGKATASIARQAVMAGKLVLFMESQTREISRVAEIVTLDENNWKSGWAAVLS